MRVTGFSLKTPVNNLISPSININDKEIKFSKKIFLNFSDLIKYLLNAFMAFGILAKIALNTNCFNKTG